MKSLTKQSTLGKKSPFIEDNIEQNKLLKVIILTIEQPSSSQSAHAQPRLETVNQKVGLDYRQVEEFCQQATIV